MPSPNIIKKVSGKTAPVLRSRISTRQFRFSKDGTEDGSSHDLQQWLKRKQSVWPTDNLNPFVDKEQVEEISLNLFVGDPQLPDNLVEFSFKERAFVPVIFHDQSLILLENEGTCLHIESQEAKELTAAVSSISTEVIEEKEPSDEIVETINESLKNCEEEESADEIDDDEIKDIKDEKDAIAKQSTLGKTKKLMNQFNFCERATITYSNFLKNTGTQTKPPIRMTFSNYATQWIIYDSYQENYEMQEREKEKGKREKSTVLIKKEDFQKKFVTDRNDVMNTNMIKKLLILERMINQNIFDDILQDFRYYEDPSDEFQNSTGTLLPLWKFQFQEIKKLSVTDIKWNPRYFDLFGVSFGTFDFQKQSSNGCFCLWSLKNPSYPDFVTYTQSGVMSLDFHISRPYLVVVGLHNGTVAVYDFRFNSKSPIYQSNHVDNKHCGIVWQVQWGEDLTDGEMIFYSVSSDGSVFNWILMQNYLSLTSIITLYNKPEPNSLLINEENNQLKDCGMCIALHPTDHLLFLIGTEEGYIYKCSTAYLATYLFTYEAHHMPVHRLDYNKYSPNIFASCSADWSIKIWEDNRKEPLFVFDTASSVADVKWAPYSSTVLAAVCFDCKTYVFDLNVDKYKAICVQTICSKKFNKLTKLAFNWKLPVIVVGDDKGISSVLKLSPNLRIKPRVTKKQQGVDLNELEIIKLEKLLSLIREPTEKSKSIIIQSSDSTSI